MKIIKYALLMALVLALAINPVFSESSGKKSDDKDADKPDTIAWLAYDEALPLLKENADKHMFIDFTASWCGWCKKMEKDTFSKPEVIDLVNEYFIPVKVWGDSNDMLDINGYKISEANFATSQFKISGYPTFWFISPEGVRIGPLRGYQPANNMMKALTWVKDYGYDTTRVENKEPEKKDKDKK